MKNLHFAGIGGIGMSGLAAAAADLNWQVSGSDRASENPENRALFAALKFKGIAIYPQDGSRYRDLPLPEALVYSTAIEESNPDFRESQGTARIHRAELLGILLEEFKRLSIAVTGSCGKSTVCCYLAEALTNLGADPVMLAGAFAKRFITAENAGNYRPGKGRHLVFEADESDKSLLKYGADYAVILNIGTDHYSKEELVEVFAGFLKSIRRGAVLTAEVYDALKGRLPENLEIRVVYPEYVPQAQYTLRSYKMECGGVPEAVFGENDRLTLPASGRHSAVNALCIRAMLEMLGFSAAESLDALKRFDGVRRRDDYAGVNCNGAKVYDDYAHNPEKILSCLTGMRERVCGKVFAVFQPHGYGPFGFMQETLGKYMDEFLRPDDVMILLEPYYAGGTSSFTPKAADVAEAWRQKCQGAKERFIHLPDRESVRAFLEERTSADDIIVIMGARDNTLGEFARSMVK